MSAARTFVSVVDVREAVARSLGFGVRACAPDEEPESCDPSEEDVSAAAEVGAEEPVAEEPAAEPPPAEEAETDADRALQEILERITSDETGA